MNEEECVHKEEYILYTPIQTQEHPKVGMST